MCFPFSSGKGETHKQFDPHPFPGQSREVVHVYWFFSPPSVSYVFVDDGTRNRIVGLQGCEPSCAAMANALTRSSSFSILPCSTWPRVRVSWLSLSCWPGPSAEMCRGFLLYRFWRILPGIFLEDFSGHFFPQK